MILFNLSVDLGLCCFTDLVPSLIAVVEVCDCAHPVLSMTVVMGLYACTYSDYSYNNMRIYLP